MTCFDTCSLEPPSPPPPRLRETCPLFSAFLLFFDILLCSQSLPTSGAKQTRSGFPRFHVVVHARCDDVNHGAELMLADLALPTANDGTPQQLSLASSTRNFLFSPKAAPQRTYIMLLGLTRGIVIKWEKHDYPAHFPPRTDGRGDGPCPRVRSLTC